MDSGRALDDYTERRLSPLSPRKSPQQYPTLHISTLLTAVFRVNDIPGPVFYSSSKIVTVLVPYAVANATAVKVKVVYNGKSSEESTLPVVTAAPGLFSADSGGSGAGVILNADYSLNSEENPAEPGGVVVLYGRGGGVVQAAVSEGTMTMAATPLVSETSVTVNGEPAEVLYAGNAGGACGGRGSGKYQAPEDRVGDGTGGSGYCGYFESGDRDRGGRVVMAARIQQWNRR